MSLAPPHLPSPAPTPDDPGSLPPHHAHHPPHHHQPANSLTQNQNLNQPPNTQEQLLEQAKIRTQIEDQLLRLSQDLYEMEICAGDVEKDMENAVPTYLARVNAGFMNLSGLAGKLDIGEGVPGSVVEHVDHYRNPHLYTKTSLSRASGENQYALGRVLGLEAFRRQLEDAISMEFPAIPLPEKRFDHARALATTRVTTNDGIQADSIIQSQNQDQDQDQSMDRQDQRLNGIKEESLDLQKE